MEKTMTLLEVLQDAVKTLSGLRLSVDYVDTVGVELSRVMKNLQACVECLEKNEGEKDGTKTNAE